MGKDATADHVDLEKAMTDGREAFLGGPADEPEPPAIIGPAGADEINDDVVVDPEKALPAGKTKEKPAATTIKEQPDKPAAEDFRFKSQEEAEKGYKNIQSEKTRLEQRAKALEEELTVLRQEREKQTREASAAEAEKTFLEYCTERHEQALTEIDQLDPEAPDYRKKAANIWAKKDADIRRKDIEMRPGVSAGADKGSTGTEHPAGAARTPAGDGAATDPVTQVHRYVEETIAAAGLPSDDPLFWMYAQQAPDKDAAGAPLDLDRQIEWALEKTNNYRASLLDGANKKKTDEANARGRQEQLRTQPMGRVATERGAPPGGGKEADNLKPVSLDEAVEFALEKRRL